MEGKLKAALQLTFHCMRATPGLADRARRLGALMSFGGDPLALGYSTSLGDIMHGLRSRGKRPVEFLRPGPPALDLDGLAGVRAYILGPPRSVAQVKAMNDPGGETYEQRKALGRAMGFVTAIDHATGEKKAEDDEVELTQPFEPHLRKSPAEAAEMK